MHICRYALPVAICLLTHAPAHAAVSCSDLIPPSSPTDGLKRSLTARDLVQVRDIGSSLANDPAARAFSISPDRTRIAFQIRRAEPDTNTYCTGMFVLPLLTPSKLLRVDLGGEFIKTTFRAQGFARSISPGTPLIIEPRWSPDGSRIAYLRRDAGVTQVWIALADGSGSRPVTRLKVDVEGFAWKDAATLVVSSRPGLARFAEGVEAEGKGGLLYDDRWIPASSNRPLARDPIPTVYNELDLATGRLSDGSEADQELLTAPGRSDAPASAILFARSRSGATAWTRSRDSSSVTSTDALWLRWPRKADQECALDICSGIVSLWWAGDQTLYFQRSAGSPTGRMAIYKLTENSAPHLVLDTPDYLSGCQLSGKALLCRDEGSLQPGRIVSIDLASGDMTSVFDPNPEFRGLRLGPARRLTWANAYGIRTYGDLVMPPDSSPGERVPLIIVQYNSRGFLRGGTGDEFPIQLFATHGFAVLSVNRPEYFGLAAGAKTWEEMNRLSIKDWTDRKSVLSSIETAVTMLVNEGIVDPRRVGITGLSDGASTVQFAIINSRMFAAAAMGTCCDEEASPGFLAGEANGAWLQAMGYPKLTADGSAFWAKDSLRANAATMNVPLLMQVPDDEYLGALEGYVALHEQHKPAELYVFPGETHIKWQPAHRLAAYQRYVDWFDFWLNDKEDPDPSNIAQYRRWEALRSGH